MDEVHNFFNVTKNYLHKSFGVQIRAEIVRELIQSPQGARLLDLGCGNGEISTQFVESNHVTFVDLSENMIELVKTGIDARYQGNATYIVGSMFDLELAKEYDYIFAIGLLAHVPSVPDCIAQIFSMLKPGGTAIIQFSDFDHWLTRWNIRNSAHYGYGINKLTRQEMKAIVNVHNWELENEIRFSFMLPGMGRLPDPFLYRYSRFVRKSNFLSKLGTDYIWHLRKL